MADDWQVPGSRGDDSRRDSAGERPAGGPPQHGAPQQRAPQQGPVQRGPVQPGAPQPGSWQGVQQRPVVPLRPLGLGDVLAGAFTVFRRNARVLLLWGLLLSGTTSALALLLNTLVQRGMQERLATAATGDADTVFAGTFTLQLVVSVLVPLLAVVGRGMLAAPVAVDTGQRVLGRRGTFGGLWALLAGRRRSVLWWVLLQLGAGVVLGGVLVALVVSAGIGVGSAGGSLVAVVVTLLVLLPAAGVLLVWLGTKFALTVPTIALEGRGVFAAAAQSWRLTRGAFWRTFGILLLVYVVFGLAASIAGIPLTIAMTFGSGVLDPLGSTATGSSYSGGAVVGIVVGGVLTIAVQTVTDVLRASITTFLAIDRRIRTEGLDQRIAAHLETGDPADPFAPAPLGAAPTVQQQWGGPWAPPPAWGTPQQQGQHPPQQGQNPPQQGQYPPQQYPPQHYPPEQGQYPPQQYPPDDRR